MAIYDVMKSGFSFYYKVEANSEQEAIDIVKRHPEYFYEEVNDEAVYDVLLDEYVYGATFDGKGLEELSVELRKALDTEE